MALCLLLAVSSTDINTVTNDIVEAILRNYGPKRIRPSASWAASSTPDGCSVADSIEAQVHVDRLHDIKLRTQTWGMNGYLRSWWVDPRLRFNQTLQCVDKVSLSREEIEQIWTPQFYWERALSVQLPRERAMVESGAGQLFYVYPDGHVFWSQQANFELACPLKLQPMPFDAQACSFIMGMYSYDASQVALRWRSGVDALGAWEEDVALVEFVPVALKQSLFESSYVGINYSYAQAQICFRRRPNALLIAYFMPALVMVGVSMLGFYIDPASMNARVALGVIVLVVVLNNYIALNTSLPRGTAVTWLSSFLLTSFGFNVLAFIEQVAVAFGIQITRWIDEETKQIHLNRSWKQALRRLGRSELEKVFSEWDIDKSGALSKQEFRNGVCRLLPNTPIDELNRLFDLLDQDHSGTLTLTEVTAAIFSGAPPPEQSTKSGSRRPTGPWMLSRGLTRTITRSRPTSVRNSRFSRASYRGGGDPDEGEDVDDAAPAGVVSVASTHVVISGVELGGPQAAAPAVTEGTSSNAAPPESARPAPLCSTGSESCGVGTCMANGEPSSQTRVQYDTSGGGCTSPRRGSSSVAARLSSPLSLGHLAPLSPLSRAERSQSQTEKAAELIRKSDIEDLDKGCRWAFKYHVLFPPLAKLRHLDHTFRAIYPLAYFVVCAHFAALREPFDSRVCADT